MYLCYRILRRSITLRTYNIELDGVWRDDGTGQFCLTRGMISSGSDPDHPAYVELHFQTAPPVQRHLSSMQAGRVNFDGTKQLQ